jgi:resorcinol 4-hydroxylase (FADH2)
MTTSPNRATSYNDRGAALLDTARRLAPIIRSAAADAERARRIPSHIFAALRESGIFRILVPRRFGGYELDLQTAINVILEISSACASTGWVTSCAISHQWMAAQFPLRSQEETWRNGADKMVVTSFTPSGECRRVDGGIRITGTWRYASGCDYADVALLGVMLPPVNASDSATPAFVVVPMAACERQEDWDTMGLAATGSHAVVARDLFVPDHCTLPAQAFVAPVTPGTAAFATNLGRYPAFSLGAYGLTATAVGCLQGALSDQIALLGEWRTRALGKAGAKVADFAAVQMRIGRAAAALKAAKAVMFTQIEESRAAVMDRGELLGQAARVENRFVQTYAVQLAVQGLDELWAIAGATGIHHSQSLQRSWRDGHAIAHHAFFNWDALSAMYGQSLLGLEPKGPH